MKQSFHRHPIIRMMILSCVVTLSSCAYHIHWKEPYKSYVGVDLLSRNELWLYDIDYQLTGLRKLHPLMRGNMFPDEGPQRLPPGTLIRFDKAIYAPGIGGGKSWMQGHLNHRGKRYEVGLKFDLFHIPSDSELLEKNFVLAAGHQPSVKH